jgi:hypothetical protein
VTPPTVAKGTQACSATAFLGKAERGKGAGLDAVVGTALTAVEGRMVVGAAVVVVGAVVVVAAVVVVVESGVEVGGSLRKPEASWHPVHAKTTRARQTSAGLRCAFSFDPSPPPRERRISSVAPLVERCCLWDCYPSRGIRRFRGRR